MSPAFGSRYFEDPTVAQTAALEYDRVWQRIGARVETGEWYYRAREIVLAEEIPDIGKAFGKPVADRVMRAIQQTDPAHLPQTSRDAVTAAHRRLVEDYLIRTRGRVSWVNRLSLHLWGRAFW